MSKANGTKHQDQERRRYFRIEDSVVLKYKTIPMDELSARVVQLEDGIPDHFTVSSSLSAIGQGMATQLKRIEEKSPDVARYLKLLDEKIDLLARAFLSQERDLADQPASEVNISAAGMAFRAETPIELGAILEIKMILFPSFTGVLTYGEVVRCAHRPLEGTDFTYEIAVDFSFMREADREQLIRHILGRQQTQIQAQHDLFNDADISN